MGTPVAVDVHDAIADLLGAFDDAPLRESYRPDRLPLTLGVLRAMERFPPSNRFRTRDLLDWERRTRAVLPSPDAFDVLTDPAFASLMPYAALPVDAFGAPVRTAIAEIARRLQIDPRGFSVLWIGSGAHVTPLHHDGGRVSGRWHLAVRGTKQFDFLPPGSPAARRLPWWDLHRRFSALYKDPVPDTWLADGTGAVRELLTQGRMVQWDRGWWHRVEIARDGVTVGLSTRGHVALPAWHPTALAHIAASRLVGEVEHYLDAIDADPPERTRKQLLALSRMVTGELAAPLSVA